MRIDIFSDTVCPWCFIGKRRLEAALAERPQPGLVVRWRPFQLNPAMPLDGMERRAYLDAKFGGRANAARVYQTIQEGGESVGIHFRFDRIARTPNTLKSHQLLQLAAERGDQGALMERLLQLYFLEGADIGEPAVLANAATVAGLDPTEMHAALTADVRRDAVLQADTQARQAGIQGVPTFVFNGRFALSGAQEPKVLMQMFDLARESMPETVPE